MKEAVELIEAVEESGLIYAYGENYCYMPAPYEMKKLYKSGEIGEFEYGEGEYYFVSYKYLTTDPDGEAAPLTLDQLINLYPAFTKCAEKTVYAKGVVNCNTSPENQTEVAKKLAKGDAVTVVATGKVNYADWYIFKTADGSYFFAGQDLFSESAQVG